MSVKDDKTGFQIYNVLVRLGGSRYNEIRKTGITAPEVMLLGSIHGPDSIADIKAPKGDYARTAEFDSEGNPTGKSHLRTDREERARLMQVYEGADSRKRGFVQRVFGPSTMPLPRVLDSDYAPQEQVDVQIISQEMRDVGVEANAAMVG